MPKLYAGIGSRKTPPHILSIMTRIAQKLHSQGYILRSGGAKGADSAFEEGAGTMKEIYTARNPIPDWAFQTVDEYHPAPHRLKDYARRLHARNAQIVFGENTGPGDRVSFAVCWTPNAEIAGGTGQLLRIAEAHGIKVRNLADPQVLESVMNWLNK